MKIKRFFSLHKCIIILILIMFVLSFGFSQIVAFSVSNYNGVTIVIDAGHGGVDVKLGQYIKQKSISN